MEITREKSGEVAALVSFRVDSDRFDSNYERNKFYRGLYGWKQVVKKHGKKYTYNREGLLDSVPHMKVDRSVYIFPFHSLEKVVKYLENWKGKVDYKTFRILLDEDRFKRFKDETRKEKEWIDVPVE